jgi:hypothetical protein
MMVTTINIIAANALTVEAKAITALAFVLSHATQRSVPDQSKVATNSIGSTIERSSFSGLLTCAEMATSASGPL